MTTIATTKPPTPEQIDAAIALYNEVAQRAAHAETVREAAERELTALVRAHGTKSETASQSFTLRGLHHEAMVTLGMTRSLVDDRILALREYLKTMSLTWVFQKMFEESKKFTLINGAQDTLAGLDLPKKTREKVLMLFGQCIDVKNQKPKLKVKAVAVKPAKKPRAGKAVA